ncbi:MAG: isoprenyl transferase [Bacteroidales bacterium]|nr:isoprenyl transferase [Bacteroidales bacterium]
MSSLLDEIKAGIIPKHIALIMDGNGRWAKQKNQPRLFGHQQGAVAVRETLEGALLCGVKCITIYAFSIENWNRPQDEVNGLMHLFIKACEDELPNLQEKNIAFKAIGNLSLLNQDCLASLQKVEQATANNKALLLQVAISYGARWEITNAAKNMAKDIMANKINIDAVDENLFGKYLLTDSNNDPDLLIRTSGEYRISNFLLWQLAYSELYFTNCYWPDFNKEELWKAIADYQKRERRFGKTSEQITTNK